MSSFAAPLRLLIQPTLAKPFLTSLSIRVLTLARHGPEMRPSPRTLPRFSPPPGHLPDSDDMKYLTMKWRHYLDAYREEFARIRIPVSTLLEIGIAGGGSLEMWRQMFPDTKI